MTKLKINDEIVSAAKIIKAHPSVKGIIEGPSLGKNGFTSIIAAFEVPLPSREINAGVSSSGVHPVEPVILLFPPNYPLKSPRIRLRADFNRSLPHINPGKPGDLVSPCIYDGSLDELLHQPHGLNEILNQIATWLRKAAANTLIDASQGWEPSRRDAVEGYIIYDIDELRQRINKKEGALEFTCHYILMNGMFVGRLLRGQRPLYTSAFVSALFHRRDITEGTITGNTFFILAWPPEKDASGKNITTDSYLPEDIVDLAGLLGKAELYGCNPILQLRLQQLYGCYKQIPHLDEPFHIVVTLCARRPINLIGENSGYELLAYLVACKPSDTGVINGWDLASPVKPLGHRHAVTASLLQRMSGTNSGAGSEIVQLGCGSLGSKITMHLARCGYGPFTLVDNKLFSPHNIARHALANSGAVTLGQYKSAAMRDALSQLGQQADAINDDIVNLADRCKKAGNFISGKAKIIIDSTASLSVREALASVPGERMSGRLIHTALYSSGKIGIILSEGPERSPRIDDLAAKMFDLTIDNAVLRQILPKEHDPFRRHEIGQGCGSHTMVMPDTRISIYAASMAEYIRKTLEADFTSKLGVLLIGSVGQDELSINWQSVQLGKSVGSTVVDGKKWEVRILSDVAHAIDQESRRYSSHETGGVLIGKVSFSRRCAIVTRTLPAPPDSVRNGATFKLGVKGLKENVRKVQEASGNLLTYLGTWHSHPMGGGPSDRDYQTLRRMKELRLGWPTINLIWSSGHFYALIDEGDMSTDST